MIGQQIGAADRKIDDGPFALLDIEIVNLNSTSQYDVCISDQPGGGNVFFVD